MISIFDLDNTLINPAARVQIAFDDKKSCLAVYRRRNIIPCPCAALPAKLRAGFRRLKEGYAGACKMSGEDL